MNAIMHKAFESGAWVEPQNERVALDILKKETFRPAFLVHFGKGLLFVTVSFQPW